jgi:hypothetical protein
MLNMLRLLFYGWDLLTMGYLITLTIDVQINAKKY